MGLQSKTFSASTDTDDITKAVKGWLAQWKEGDISVMGMAIRTTAEGGVGNTIHLTVMYHLKEG